MKRRLLLAMFLMFAPLYAEAQVMISEMLYDLPDGSETGREWIEIYNAGDEPVSLQGWSVIDNGKNRALQAVSGGTILPARSYAVIADNAARFKADWPGFAGQLFDSSFRLSNTGETIRISDASRAVIDEAAYGDVRIRQGDSLHRESLSADARLIASLPTPGAAFVPVLPDTPPENAGTSPDNAAIAAEEGRVSGTEIMRVPEPGASWLWWLWPAFAAFVASAGVLVSRHFKKDEWEIEEMVESS